MFTEKDGKKKIRNALALLNKDSLMIRLYEINLDEILSEKLSCHLIENLDIMFTDGIFVYIESVEVPAIPNLSSYRLLNATYLVLGRNTDVNMRDMSPIYQGKVYVFPGFFENEKKVDELIERLQIFTNIEKELLDHIELFGVDQTLDTSEVKRKLDL